MLVPMMMLMSPIVANSHMSGPSAVRYRLYRSQIHPPPPDGEIGPVSWLFNESFLVAMWHRFSWRMGVGCLRVVPLAEVKVSMDACELSTE